MIAGRLLFAMNICGSKFRNLAVCKSAGAQEKDGEAGRDEHTDLEWIVVSELYL